MNFNELPEFQKELKRLAKNYKSLPDDLQQFCDVVSVIPLGNSKHFNIVLNNNGLCVIKARLFCRYLKKASLRIIYAYFEQEQRIEFIELYFKGKKGSENKERINEYTNLFGNS